MTETQKWYREEYLRSSHWLNLRQRAFDRYGKACSVLGCKNKKINLHHLTYLHLGEMREINDVRPLCWIHHWFAHHKIWGMKKIPLNMKNLTERFIEIKRFHWRHFRFSDIVNL